MTFPLRRVLLPLGVLLVVAAAAGAWIGYTALQARDHLTVARQVLPGMRSALLTGNSEDAAARLDAVTTDAEAAYTKTHDPVWSVAARVPWLGEPLRTVRGVTEAVRQLTVTSLPTLVSVAGQVQPARLRPAPDTIDVATLAKVAGPVEVAANDLDDQRDSVRALPPSWVTQVADARAELLGELEPLATSTRRIATAAQVVPGMLGNDGPRTYFLGFQNPAESRGTGGLLGAFAIVRAEGGKVSVERLGANTALPKVRGQLKGLDPGFVSRAEDQGATTLWVNSNISPDFAEVAQLWQSMWLAGTGEEIDGAIAVDPASLAAVLRATGPVQTARVGTVSADSVERLVLRGQYELTDVTAQRKDLMVGVGRAVVDAVLSGAGDPRALITEVSGTARAGHVLVYSASPQEQAVLVDAGVSGQLPGTTRPFAQAVVVNAAGSKLDSYLRTGLDYSVRDCNLSARTAIVTVTVRNDAPRTGLPAYVVTRADDPPQKTVPGQNRLQVQVVLTKGAVVTGATLDGKRIAMAPPLNDLPNRLDLGEAQTFLDSAQQGQHPAYTTILELEPGQQRELVLQLNEPPSLEEPLLPRQPLAHAPKVTADTSACADV